MTYFCFKRPLSGPTDALYQGRRILKQKYVVDYQQKSLEIHGSYNGVNGALGSLLQKIVPVI